MDTGVNDPAPAPAENPPAAPLPAARKNKKGDGRGIHRADCPCKACKKKQDMIARKKEREASGNGGTPSETKPSETKSKETSKSANGSTDFSGITKKVEGMERQQSKTNEPAKPEPEPKKGWFERFTEALNPVIRTH